VCVCVCVVCMCVCVCVCVCVPGIQQEIFMFKILALWYV